ncbi:MAG: exodeoxyribonuclease VII small subunit [Rhodothermales bacterium]
MSAESSDKPESKTFEIKLKELEAIVEKLENDMPPLEEALSSYEDGISIAKDCLGRLEKAELRIRELKLDD